MGLAFLLYVIFPILTAPALFCIRDALFSKIKLEPELTDTTFSTVNVFDELIVTIALLETVTEQALNPTAAV
jgi:hypothetical protein